MLWKAILSVDFIIDILRATTPILLATLGACMAAKAGICNMALDGIMLFAALFGVIFSNLTGSWIASLILTAISGAIMGAILAFFVLNLKTDEILAAIAINLTATGGTVLLLLAFSGDRGSSTFETHSAPAFHGINIMTVIALVLVVVIHLFLYKTPLGLQIRSVGENKDAAESVGIKSIKIQYIALILSGTLGALGGYFLSSGYMNAFTKNMQSGRGFIALAAAAMGANTPIGGFIVALLFGAAQAIANQLQLTSIPVELIQMIPYATVLVGLAVFSYSAKKKKEKLSNS